MLWVENVQIHFKYFAGVAPIVCHMDKNSIVYSGLSEKLQIPLRRTIEGFLHIIRYVSISKRDKRLRLFLPLQVTGFKF